MTEKRYCPNCEKETTQETSLYNPDAPEEGGIWNCTKCEEAVGIVEEDKDKKDKDEVEFN